MSALRHGTGNAARMVARAVGAVLAGRLVLPVSVALLALAAPLAAQIPDVDLDAPPLTFGGEAGTFSELYGIDGAEKRRPGATARLYFRPTMSFYGLVTVRGDFLVSTEGNQLGAQARQNINRYALSPEWSWGRATVGDFSGSYSPLTYNGIRARGASLEVERGALQLSMFGGRSQRAVDAGAVSGGYSRTVAGGRLGVGDPDGTSLALVMVTALDDPDSLDEPTDTLFLDPQPDTTFVEDTLSIGRDNRFAVTPQQNLVVSVLGSVALLDGRVKLEGELAGSGYTRDRRSDVIDNPEILDRIPGIAEALFTPRTSSSADYAYTLEGQFAPIPALTSTLTFRNLGAGYVSLGTASLLADRREIQSRTALRLGRVNASLDLGRQNDNLADQKAFTTTRDRLGASLSARLTRRWSSSLRLQHATLGNEASDPERWIAYGSWLMGTRQSLAFGRASLLRSTSVDYNFRMTGDDNPLRVANTSWSHTASWSLVLQPSRTVSITPSAGLVHSKFAQDDWATRTNLGIAGQLAMARGRWVSGLNLSRTNVHTTTALQASFTSRFQLTESDAFVLGARLSDNENLADPDLSFTESTVSLRWTRRF